MIPSIQRRKDFYGGVLVSLIGVCVVVGGAQYHLGTLAHMGPGYFPTLVGALLVLIGLGIAITTRPVQLQPKPKGFGQLRAWGCILGGLIAFAILGEYGGLVPATFAVVFISALGDTRNSIRHAILLALALVAIGIFVFWWALNLQFPLFRWG